MSSSSTPFRQHLGSNPWIFLNPSCANALLLLFVVFVFVMDLIVIMIHINITLCSNTLKFWIIGKYFAPLLSYLSCCCFVPCNFDETLEVTTSIPYSQHELRQIRIRQSVFSNPITEIRKNPDDKSETQINNNNHHHLSHHIQLSSSSPCPSCSIPYPYDVMSSEWLSSPSTITSNIAQSIDDSHSYFCKFYIYFIGIIFDRGVLELLWLFIGGLIIISEDNSCQSHTPILYYYVSLQIVLGSVITFILLLWIISLSLCPLQVARCMACCYGMQCDILGLLPPHLFQRLLTMHNSFKLNQSLIKINNNNNKYSYSTSSEISKNYHTLSTVPHHYQHENNNVELTTSLSVVNNQKNKNNKKEQIIHICSMCHHSMDTFCDDDINILECGHEFHSLCIDAWPINSKCPQCKKNNNKLDEETQNNEESDIDDSDNELEACDTDRNTTDNQNLLNVRF